MLQSRVRLQVVIQGKQMAASSSPAPQQDGRYNQLNRQQRGFGAWVTVFAIVVTLTTLALLVVMIMSLMGQFSDGYIAPPV